MARRAPLPLPGITLGPAGARRSHTQERDQGGAHPQRRLKDHASSSRRVWRYTTKRDLTVVRWLGSGIAPSMTVGAGRPAQRKGVRAVRSYCPASPGVSHGGKDLFVHHTAIAAAALDRLPRARRSNTSRSRAPRVPTPPTSAPSEL